MDALWRNTTTKWDIKIIANAKLTYNYNGQKVTAYQDYTEKGYWRAKDITGHGGSAYKVFEKRGNELHWVADADEYGNFITDKHKSQTGMVIKLKVWQQRVVPEEQTTRRAGGFDYNPNKK